MITTVILFVIVLGILVLVHEFGHFIVAKRSGMVVEEFGFGFPPRLVGIQRIDGKLKFVWTKNEESHKGTIYSINFIPLGGFVRILGENNDASEVPGSFTSKKFFPRLLTLIAGIVMNVILAWVLFSGGYMVGLPVGVDDSVKLPSNATLSDPRATILEVDEGSPADKSGLQANDAILSIDGNNFSKTEDVQKYIASKRGNKFEFKVLTEGVERVYKVESIKEPKEGEGSVGITMVTVGKLRYPFGQAIVEGFKTTGIQIYNIFYGLKQLFVKGEGLDSIGGPVKIAQMTGEVANMGLVYLMQFTAFLSLNLAVLNSLPFPALDGGRVLFLLIEKIRGKKNNQRFEQYANTIGFALLLLLMLVVTVKDTGIFGS